MAEAGFDVRVITAFPHYPAWAISEGYSGRTVTEMLSGVHVKRVRPFMPSKLNGLNRLFLEVRFGVRAVFSKWGKPDVLVLVSPALFATAVVLIRARLSINRPSIVVWVQDLYSLGVTETGALGGLGGRAMAIFESVVLNRADLVVAIHNRFKRYISSALDVPEEKIAVVRNWTHLPSISVNRVDYRTKFGWGDETVVLHAGNMGAKQALENVVAAARLADVDESPVRFVLLGNGNQREAIVARAVGAVRIEFLGSLNDEDFQGAMSAADILLVNEKPGVSEMAVPSKLTSYFSASRPVIAATDAGSITAEEIEVSNAGVRADAGDPRALLDAVLDLRRHPERAEQHGQCGAEFQKRVLSSHSAIAQYAEIINSLAGKRGR
jgi:colanic acid biosynthesis glycosyl transferase WcaI